MALEDKDFIKKQVEGAAKGLAKVIDLNVLEQMLSKENIDRLHELDKNSKEEFGDQ